MSEHMFGTGKGRISDEKRELIDEIAQRHDAHLTNPDIPGEGWIYWFAGPNRGHPFDKAMADAVRADLDAAGLLPENCLVGSDE